ncbi:MAG: hypothetical protein JNM79_01170 [Burkholderiales bacterium]|nr:hypothetical protein [Burkholderiales bacterium]
MLEGGMWIILLEMLIAFALAIFIVWWTWPKKPAPPAARKEDDEKEKP